MSHKTFIRGDDYEIVLKVKSDVDTVKDLTNVSEIHYTICYSPKTELSDVSFHCEYGDGISVPIATEGIILIQLPAEVTRKLTNTQVYHKCWLVDESGRTTTLFGEWRNMIDEKFKEIK